MKDVIVYADADAATAHPDIAASSISYGRAYMKQKGDKLVLKIFDGKNGGERKPHVCSTCQAYKREIARGNTEALQFYKVHINEIIKKYGGVTVVLEGKLKMNAASALPRGKI
jgi:hypothetical protein